MAYEVNINPLDLETDVGIGILLNISSPSGRIFNVSYTTIQQAKTNFYNLLLTNEGERIMHPDFGCNLRKIVFENIDSSIIKKLDSTIRKKTDKWLPYIDIKKLNIIFEPNNNLLEFDIVIALKANSFETEQITFTAQLK